ncbi:MAG TPA: EAL domain-containing protein [Thermoanaerobaculia bacterium]
MRVGASARYLGAVLGLSAGLVLFSLAVLFLQPRNGVSLVYPATGLGVAVLWGLGFRYWPAIVLAQFVLSYNASHNFWVAILVACIELLVTTIFCAVMLNFRVSRDLQRLRDLTLFTTGAILAPIVGGLATIAGEYFFETRVLRRLIADGLSFWLSDSISILIFVPLILGWRRWPFHSRKAFERWLAVSLLLIIAGILIANGGERFSATIFLLLPLVVFTATVGGMPGAAASGAILLFIFVAMHVGAPVDRMSSIIRVIFVGTSTVTGYILAVVWGERELNAKRLFQLAHHDPLTGLVNRHELERRLSDGVLSGVPSAHALLYLDLDQFKLVNDTCGHIAGDRMLQELSVELLRTAPPGSVLARLGGDEFACIAYDMSEEQALALATRLHDAVASYRFRYGSMSFGVGVSIGITFFPADDGDTADAVLGRADIACYVAKEDGRHRSHVYLPRDEAMLRWHSSIQQVSQLEMAMQDGRLQLYRQSIVDITGATSRPFDEVLLRLASDGGVHPSAEFLPVAQRFGLMEQIDRWVVEHACRHLAESDEHDLRLSINVSGSTLNDPDFYQHVIRLPERYGVDPRRLCLEVTEGVVIHRLRQAVQAMKDLRARGFDLALDDFGAGVASFAYLQELPVTYVKIDGRIVQQLRSDPASEVIIGSLVKLARLREIECIAEWVEDAETMDRLRALGVRYAQGFFIDRPSPLAERNLVAV